MGFALPTILIASVVLMIILVSSIAVSGAIRTSLDDTYYNQISREAAEAGLVRAQNCLRNNNNAAQWTTASPLRPGGACTGDVSQCTLDSCYVLYTPRIRTTFSVIAPDAAGAVCSEGPAGVTIKQVTLGAHHGCVLASNGKVSCWGG